MSDPLCRSQARPLGILYLLYFLTAVSGGLLQRGLVVPGDPALSAHNLATHEVAVRASSGLGLISVALYLALTTLFYELFRPVSRRFSFAATLLSVTGCILQASGDVFFLPVQLLAAGRVGGGTDASTLLVRVLLGIHAQSIYSSLVFFGAFDLLIGLLILRSRFLPRIFGLLMALAGLGWLLYLSPPLAATLSRVVQPLGFLAEAALMVWLLAKGVDEGRWRASAASDMTPSLPSPANAPQS